MMSLMLHIPSNQANTFMYARPAVPRIDEPTAIPTLTRDTRWFLFFVDAQGFRIRLLFNDRPFPVSQNPESSEPAGRLGKAFRGFGPCWNSPSLRISASICLVQNNPSKLQEMMQASRDNHKWFRLTVSDPPSSLSTSRRRAQGLDAFLRPPPSLL